MKTWKILKKKKKSKLKWDFVLNLSRFNNNGNWIRGFSHNLGITTSLVTKMWGLCDGLSLACGLNISKLIIEINAKSMVDLLRPVNVITPHHILIVLWLIIASAWFYHLKKLLFIMFTVRAIFARIFWQMIDRGA